MRLVRLQYASLYHCRVIVAHESLELRVMVQLHAVVSFVLTFSGGRKRHDAGVHQSREYSV